MNIQPPRQAGALEGRLSDSALDSAGLVGNLQFNAEQRGTMRGSGHGGLPSAYGSSTNMDFSVNHVSPQACARRDILIQARGNLYRVGNLLYSLAAPPTRDLSLFQEALKSINNGLEIQGIIMLGRLHAALRREIHARAQPELEQLQERLAQAVRARERLAASKALYDLNALVDRNQQAYGPLPDEMAEYVRILVESSLNLFRDAENNPKGPLNVASLIKLDDSTFVYLRQASSLHCLGLKLDLKAASAVAHGRIGVLSWRAVEGMMNVLRTLAEEAVDGPALIWRLRELSGLELKRIQQLMELGEFARGGAGPDERRAMAERTCELAMNELSRTPRQVPIVHNAMRHMRLLIDLESTFGRIASELRERVVQEEHGSDNTEIVKQLVMTQYLLTGVINEMNRRLSGLLAGTGPSGVDIGVYVDLISRMIPTPAVVPLLKEMDERLQGVPYEEFVETLNARYRELEGQAILDPAARLQASTFYRALRSQYGVAYDPAARKATMSVTESICAKMVPGLETLLFKSSRVIRAFTLPVDGADKAFTMGAAFHEEALERGNIVLSVRGSDEDGQPIHFTWPTHVSEQGLPRVMGEALDALARVARSAAEPLTCLMDLGAITRTVEDILQDLDMDSPFSLDDGTVVMPRGDDNRFAIFDVVRNEDSSFRFATTFRIFGIRTLRGVRTDGAAVIVNLNSRAANWAEVHFNLHLSPDAQRIRVNGLPQFRHYFDVNEIVVDPRRFGAAPTIRGEADTHRP